MPERTPDEKRFKLIFSDQANSELMKPSLRSPLWSHCD